MITWAAGPAPARPSPTPTSLVDYVLTNWKMHTTVADGVELLRAIQAGLEDRASGGATLPTVIVCPPFVSLTALREVANERLVHLGAQNCHWEAEGPFTGEVSPTMLRGLVDYVLIGHSERRAAGETDEEIAKKVGAVADAGLTPVLFVGEDEPSQAAMHEAEQRLRRGIDRLDLERQRILVVYEPTWAVGAEQAAEAGHVRELVEHLKDRLAAWGASRPEVIYGGTVNADNVEALTAIESLDGVGATRAGLDPEQFLGIVDHVTGTGA